MTFASNIRNDSRMLEYVYSTSAQFMDSSVVVGFVDSVVDWLVPWRSLSCLYTS
jgi:hypothetical protein